MQRGIGKIWTDHLSIDYWQRAQEDKGRPMSEESRIALFQLWNNEDNDRYIRSEAFSLWAATRSSNDLTIIMSARPSVELADNILAARLIRKDRTAIVEMIEKLRGHRAYWWQFGRYLWSSDLTEVLDETLRLRGDRATRIWGETFQEDTTTHEMVMRLPIDDGERLLIAHWDHLRFAPAFVQTALYVGTPKLLLAAQTAIGECPQPTLLFATLKINYGIKVKGPPGLRNEAQIRALAPYFDLLRDTDIAGLWEACNDHGWFDVRQELLDPRLQPPYSPRLWNRKRASEQLDGMVGERHAHRSVVDWIDNFRNTGVLWSEILSTLTEWLVARQSYGALRIVALAIEHAGTRDEFALVREHKIGAEYRACELLADIEFSIRRRTIH